jgi:F420-non-reducing hydrogenase small subunit
MTATATAPVTVTRPRLAVYWASACGGCDIAILNLHERIVQVAEAFEIVFWPAVMDAKYAGLEAMPDGWIDLCLFTGGIRSTENAELARLLRRRSRFLVAFGSCAGEGCIPGLANLSTVDELLGAAFEGPSTDNPTGLRPVETWRTPAGDLHLPRLLSRVHTLDDVVPVDWTVPGCPPESARIAEVMTIAAAAFRGEADVPPRGSVLGAGRRTVCDECARDRSPKTLGAFTRIQAMPAIDPVRCLLEQGLPCSGPATRDGCGALCPAAGSPCIGCYGAPEGVLDAGARLLAAYGSIIADGDEADVERVQATLVDPVGRAYRFGLARSLLHGARPRPQATATAAGAAPEASSAADENAAPDRTPVGAGSATR